ncbi:MAG: MerR family DNA-binding protein [Demequinaceae bacterium]|nr:MerR family DNA-binding protein [Demequinaceae bacterium]
MLTEVGSILDMKDAGQSTCAHTRDLIHRHLAEIDEQIEALRAARKEMAALAVRADEMDPGECSDPHRCQVIATQQEGAHNPENRTRLPLAAHH